MNPTVDNTVDLGGQFGQISKVNQKNALGSSSHLGSITGGNINFYQPGESTEMSLNGTLNAYTLNQ